MAKAFVVGQKENSTLVSVKANDFMFGGRLAYVAKQENWETGETHEIPDGYTFSPIVIDGEVATTTKGDTLYTLEW